MNVNWLKSMIGTSWSISWNNGKADQYKITTEGQLSIDGVGGGGIDLVESKNAQFPSTEGWLTMELMSRTYYMRVRDGRLYVHHFGEECSEIYGNLKGYCGTGVGIDMKGERNSLTV